MLIGDYYGPKYSTTDYVLTYTAKPRGGGHLSLTEWISICPNGLLQAPFNLGTVRSFIAAGAASHWTLKPLCTESARFQGPDSHLFTRKREKEGFLN